MIITKNKVYYIGFSPINGICNELFFEGSITMYPNNEKGNIFFSNKVFTNDRSDTVVQNFRKFILEKVTELLSIDSNIQFMIFNDKKRTKEICDFIPKKNLIVGNSSEILEYLNSKEKIRNFFHKKIPILNSEWKYGFEIHSRFTELYLSKKEKMVIQGEIGAGGENTYLISDIDTLNQIEIYPNSRYCISAYKPNVPINITAVLGKEILLFPISAQLIKNERGRFIYKGADFTYPKQFSDSLKKCIQKYSLIISEHVKNMGYKGILGIDFIIDEHQNVYFMELNPRYQASSFYISRELETNSNLNLAFLHYLSLIDKPFPQLDTNMFEKIQGSFLNCNNHEDAFNIPHDYEIKNGFFPNLESSIYRKLYCSSIIDKGDFEQIKLR